MNTTTGVLNSSQLQLSGGITVPNNIDVNQKKYDSAGDKNTTAIAAITASIDNLSGNNTLSGAHFHRPERPICHFPVGCRYFANYRQRD